MKDKIDFMRTGIPLDEFPFREREFPADGEWNFVQACRLIEKKGLPRRCTPSPISQLVIRKRHSQLPAKARCWTNSSSCAQTKIDGSSVVPGFVSQENLREIYYDSHIFLHPSETGADGNQEGVPNSMLEAMASGLPVFATEHGGIPEAIENGVSGILVPERDDEALSRAFSTLRRTSILLKRLARNGANVVRRKIRSTEPSATARRYLLED